MQFGPKFYPKVKVPAMDAVPSVKSARSGKVSALLATFEGAGGVWIPAAPMQDDTSLRSARSPESVFRMAGGEDQAGTAPRVRSSIAQHPE